MADEQTALCKAIHIEVDRRLGSLERGAGERSQKMETIMLQMENWKGTVKGAILVGSAAGAIVGTLIGIAFRIFG
jgi:hypothetical protein